MALKDIRSLLTESPRSGGSQPYDPSFSGVKWTRIYQFRRAYLKTVRSSIERNEQDEDGEGYLYDYQVNADAPYCELTLYYASVQAGDSNQRQVGVPQSFLAWTQDDIPLERLPKYKTNWNYLLAAKNGVPKEAPGFWSTKKDTTLESADGAKYHWYKDSSQVPDGWYVICDATKPGIDKKLNFYAVVREVTYFDTRARAEAAAYNATSASKEPINKMGVVGYWLSLPSSINPDGSLFRVESEFFNSKVEWDKDLYE